MKSPREDLKAVKTFPELTEYLRRELNWPIESTDFEDLTFDYEPHELGIDAESAAKIQQIKQLRPLSPSQPWGIFFIKFEPKRLPVVVLRRILSQLVIKKRASARKSEQAAWQLHDLLFISNYGEGDQRQITFAHFTQDENTGDLPTLRVLGWDDADTALHLDYTHETLKNKLSWPSKPGDLKSWREQWASAFILRHREVITTSQDLAGRLADLARSIRLRASQVLAVETKDGPLRTLYKAFQVALIHDLSEDDFTDMYAQTIAYGLLAARVSRPMGIVADNITDMVPVTNPFLREMLSTFLTVGGRKGKIDFDELGIQEVVDLLNSSSTHMDAILRDFGNRMRQEDPVIHFYELFLTEYDKKKKVQRGVFYTPLPVVSYIVRSVHELLQSEFGLEDGLADTTTWGEMVKRNPAIKLPKGVMPDDPFVQILDPATGTATFLVEVIDLIHRTMAAKWIKQGHMALQITDLWNDYVPKHLLPRLYGFEILMAPYSIAHMKLGLKLFETGYRFQSEERLNIYLTNSLESAEDSNSSRVFEEWAPALAHEARAVNVIKDRKNFSVIIGNPPYAGLSSNASRDDEGNLTFIGRLIEDYKVIDGHQLDEKNPKWLHDDYVKFLRFGQWRIINVGCGILGFITNHSYIDNPTFRGMRQSFFNTFSDIRILNLHGNAKKKEIAQDGSKDENVFDIQQGVAITIAIKKADKAKQNRVNYQDLWGLREVKYKALLSAKSTTMDVILKPISPAYFFVPQNDDIRCEFEHGWKINDIFPVNSAGIVSARDGLTIHWTSNETWATVCDFVSLPGEKARVKYDLGDDATDWKVQLAQNDVKATGLNEKLVVPILYRPFDIRFIYYTGHSRGFVCRPRNEVMRHMIGSLPNIGMLWTRPMSPNYEFSAFCTRYVADQCVIGNKSAGAGISYEGPLYVYPAKGEFNLKTPRTANLNYEFTIDLVRHIGLSFDSDANSHLPEVVGPQDVFDYCYAVFHSSGYRSRYSAFLKTDIPRLHITSSVDLFCALASLGHQLVALHLMESPLLDKPMTKVISSVPTAEVAKVTFYKDTVWIDKSLSQGFMGVPEAVWNYNIGGYHVCDKWLKDRKGRALTKDEIIHYQKIITAISETIRTMAEIDQVIDAHGGWPGAFS